MRGCDVWLHVRVKDAAALGLYQVGPPVHVDSP
jgi:hypothetical protein